MITPTDTRTFQQRVLDHIPHAYLDLDATLGDPLRRWLSLLTDQAGEIEATINRLSIPDLEDRQSGDVSALVDPTLADDRWLTWLAQLAGVRLPLGVTGQAARDAIAGAVTGFQAGTRAAIAAAAASALTGSRYVSVYDHSTNTPGDGGTWDVLLVTRSSETADPAAVLLAVTSKNAKPAGVVLHIRAYSATWTTMTAAYPTWTARNGKTWTQLEEVGL